jgi:hypothetical protein
MIAARAKEWKQQSACQCKIGCITGISMGQSFPECKGSGTHVKTGQGTNHAFDQQMRAISGNGKAV